MPLPTYNDILNQSQSGAFGNTLQGIDTEEIKRFMESLNLPTLSQSGVVPYGDLADATNRFMTEQARAPYAANLPNYQGMLEQATGNAFSQLKGEVPQDVINQLRQSGAEYGIQTGNPLGPGTNAAYMRALGLNSIGQQATGAANLHQLIGDTPIPQIINPASIFVPEHLSAMELAAALAAQQQRATGGGGTPTYPGGGGVSLPGGALNDEPLGPSSWDRSGGAILSGPQDYSAQMADVRNRISQNQQARTFRDDPWNIGTVGNFGGSGSPWTSGSGPATSSWAQNTMQDVTRTGGGSDVGGFGGNYDPFQRYDFYNPPATTQQYSGGYSPYPAPRSDMEYYGNAGMPDVIGGINSYNQFFQPSGGSSNDSWIDDLLWGNASDTGGWNNMGDYFFDLP